MKFAKSSQDWDCALLSGTYRDHSVYSLLMHIGEYQLLRIRLAIIVFFTAITAAVAQQDSVEVTVRVTGSMDLYKRYSDNFLHTVEQDTTKSSFTEETSSPCTATT